MKRTLLSHSLVALLLLSLAVAMTNSPRAVKAQGGPTWVPIGPAPIPNGEVLQPSPTPNPLRTEPVSGRVTAIAIHPTDQNVVYAGTAQGGVYRTLDGGTTWTQLLANNAFLAIGAIAIDPNVPSTIYVGTGDGNIGSGSFFGGGLYVVKSSDTIPIVTGPFNSNGAGDVFTGRSISKLAPVKENDGVSPSKIIFVAIARGHGSVYGAPPSLQPALGLYRSANINTATPTFQKLTVQSSNPNDLPLVDMVLEPGNANNLLCSVLGNQNEGGVWRTTNALDGTPNGVNPGGAPTFTLRKPLGDNTVTVRSELAINKVGNAVTVLAATDEFDPSSSCVLQGLQGGKLWRSVDGGVNWTEVLSARGFCGQSCATTISVALDPTVASKMYLGGSTRGTCSAAVKKSSDSGATFQLSDTGLHINTHVIAIAPSNANVIYVGNDGGIFRSLDGGVNWTSLNTATFSATQFYSLALHPTDQNFTLAGAQGNGPALFKTDRTWTRVAKQDASTVLIDQSATDTTNVTMYYAPLNFKDRPAVGLQGRIGFARATTGNPTPADWTYLGCGPGMIANGIQSCGEDVFGSPPMAVGPGNPNTFYFATNRLYRSTDRGTNLVPASQSPLDPSGKGVSAIGISPQNDLVRIVGVRNGQVYATTTGSSTLANITSASFPPSDFSQFGDVHPFVTRAVIDPNNQNTAYVTFGGYVSGAHIWKTTNLSGAVAGANNWVAAANGLPPDPVNAFVVDPANSNHLYAGTDSGVYRSTDGGASWAPFGDGLPRIQVFDLAIHNGGRILRAATAGRGMWEISLGNVPLPAAPSGLNAAAVSSSQINLTWTDNSSDEAGFKIERCTGSGCSNFAVIAQTAANANSFNDGSVAPSTTYTYRVFAFNSGGNSDPTNTAEATTPSGPPPPPAAPSNLIASAISGTQINLSWTDNSGNESGFRIERCTGSTCTNFVQIAEVTANITSFPNTGLAKNTTYRYRVRSFNGSGNSAYSNIASATTPKK